MRSLSVFNFISLDGYYQDRDHGMRWHKHGGEEAAYSAESQRAGNTLVFGRVTYQMMASFWPTADAARALPEMAAGMNAVEKLVFSRTLTSVDWAGARLVRGEPHVELAKLKRTDGPNLTVLGSGTIVTQLAQHGLIDRYEIMIDPIALGGGTPIFHDLPKPLSLKLVATRPFTTSGAVLLSYIPA